MKITTSVKRQYKKECLIAFLIIFILAGIAVSSWLLWDNFQKKTPEEIKTTIITAIVSYGGLIWLSVKVIMDIVLYVKRFKTQIEPILEVVEKPSKYLPKQAKKVSQNALKQEINTISKEIKIRDNFVRISNKEIVIVFGKEYESKYELVKELNETLIQTSNIIEDLLRV